MTHEFGHIECGGAGLLIGEKQITIHDHEVLNVALHLKHENLVALLVAGGMSEAKATKKALRLGQIIENDAHRWYDFLEDLGVEYAAYEPNPANL